MDRELWLAISTIAGDLGLLTLALLLILRRR